jgi:hypothetical protein
LTAKGKTVTINTEINRSSLCSDSLRETEVELQLEGTRLCLFTFTLKERRKMSLKYRGVDYEPATSQVAVSEEVIGRYRGAVATRHVAQQVKGASAQGLKYRGAIVR